MANHCSFCDVRRPEGGTKMLVLNGGTLWLEFCPKCEGHELTSSTGETLTVGALYARCSQPEPETQSDP